MITPLDSRVMDANAEALGISVKELMGNAGKAVSEFLTETYPDARFAFFCGHGNNGGDGFAAACDLPPEKVKVFCITSPEKIKSQTVRYFLEQTGKAPVQTDYSDRDFDVLVDCGLGTGLSGKLRPEYAEFVRFANSFKGPVVSVDIPTGSGTDISVKADITVTLHEVKTGMTEENCGKIIVKDIGMPKKAYSETGPGDMLRYPVPAADSHKGSNGNLLIIGGGPYFGAPAMAAMAALRVGTDLVTVAAPESVFHEIADVSPVIMIDRLDGDRLRSEHVPELLKRAERCSAVLIGPGLGRDEDTARAVVEFVSSIDIPTVIDADALTAMGEFKTARSNIVLTPHHAEFERIGGGDVQERARSTGCTILLKGRTDLISDGNRLKANNTGCAGMTGAGTGDVLAGIVAGLLAKGMETFDAACLGAYISGRAGEMAFERKSYGLIATDVIEAIPDVLAEGLKDRKG